jgi:hypothetical protein
MKPLRPYQTHTIPAAYIALAFRGRREFLPWWRSPVWRRLFERRRTQVGERRTLAATRSSLAT